MARRLTKTELRRIDKLAEKYCYVEKDEDFEYAVIDSHKVDFIVVWNSSGYPTTLLILDGHLVHSSSCSLVAKHIAFGEYAVEFLPEALHNAVNKIAIEAQFKALTWSDPNGKERGFYEEPELTGLKMLLRKDAESSLQKIEEREKQSRLERLGDTRGGRIAFWTQERCKEFRELHDTFRLSVTKARRIVRKHRGNNWRAEIVKECPDLTPSALEKLPLVQYQPGDIARELAAEKMGVADSEYLTTVLTKARRADRADKQNGKLKDEK